MDKLQMLATTVVVGPTLERLAHHAAPCQRRPDLW
jgi:hypothetical protein